MNGREAILGRIREALTVATPAPGTPSHDGDRAAVQSHLEISDWLPAVDESFDGMSALFRANSAELRTDFFLLNNPEELVLELTALRDAQG